MVITSTRRPAAGLGTGVPVDVFTVAEATGFLAVRSGLADEAGALELAQELGFLPLGPAQAAALIAREHLGVRDVPGAAAVGAGGGLPGPGRGRCLPIPDGGGNRTVAGRAGVTSPRRLVRCIISVTRVTAAKLVSIIAS